MKLYLKRILTSVVFITSFAFALRMVIFYLGSQTDLAPVKLNLPFGYELGRVARAIAAGQGFSSPPLRMVDTGPTVWFTPDFSLPGGGDFQDLGNLQRHVRDCHPDAELRIFRAHDFSFRFTASPSGTFGKALRDRSGLQQGFSSHGAEYFPILWIWDTALIGLFFALIFWATLAMPEKRGLLPWAGYGALWVTGVLINPSILSLFPFFLAWLIWEARKVEIPWAKPVAVALLIFTIGLVPWTVRNYRVFGKFIVLRSNFGLELWLGNNPDVTDTMSNWAHPNDNPAEAAKYARMGEIAYMADKEHEAFAFMRTHPLETLDFMFRRFVENWLGITDSPADLWANGNLKVQGFIVLNSLLSVLCLLGALYARRARIPEAPLYAMVLLIFPLVFYMTHSSLRYRFPIDPIIVVLAVSAVAHLISVAQSRLLRGRKQLGHSPLLRAD